MFKLNPLVTVHYAHVFGEHCRGEVCLAVMALLDYVTVLPWHIAELPDPAGPLSSPLPSMVIEQATWPLHERATSKTHSLHTRCLPPPQSIDTTFTMG